mgnify:CR=1
MNNDFLRGQQVMLEWLEAYIVKDWDGETETLLNTTKTLLSMIEKKSDSRLKKVEESMQTSANNS